MNCSCHSGFWPDLVPLYHKPKLAITYLPTKAVPNSEFHQLNQIWLFNMKICSHRHKVAILFVAQL